MKEHITNEQLNKARQYFYDINFVRAIAAMSVVMVHVTAANYHLNDKHLSGFLLFLNQVSRFGTPFFAIISGFLLYNQAINGRYNTKYFISSRLTKVFIPFVIWSVIYLFVNSYSFTDWTSFEDLKQFLYYVLMGKSSYHLYFIAVVIQFYLLFPLIQSYNSMKSLSFLTIVGLYINFFYLQAPLDIGDGLVNKFFKDRAILLYWIFYFFLGGLLVHIWKPLVQFIQKNIVYVCGIGIVSISFIAYETMISEVIFGSTRLSNIVHVPLLFAFFTAIYYSLANYQLIRHAILAVGNMSMGIYLVHPLVIEFIKSDLTWMFERATWLPIGYALSILVSMLIVKIIHMLPLGHYIVIIASRRKTSE